MYFLFREDTIKYEEVDNKIIAKDYGLELEVVGSYYDKEKKCYILQTLITKDEKAKKKTSSLEFEYIFIDNENYVVGESYLYIDNFDKYNKWKKDISYCDEYAEDIREYQIKNIFNYEH